MIGFFAGFSLLIFLLNLYYLFWVYRGLKKVLRSVSPQNSTDYSFSIIIAAHNEASYINKCLESLIKQDYPKSNFEIIVVADRCTDNTVKVAHQLKDKFPYLKIVEINDVPSDVSPKKYALKCGIDEASFDHFILLDADVLPTHNHLKILNQYFSENTQVVVSIMKLTLQDSFWQNFLRYERLCNWAVSAGSIKNENPIISYGGNWAYTRHAFNAVNGFENIFQSLGGDDDLLLQKFGRENLEIQFCSNPEGWVTTQAPESLQRFIQQRRRHFAAGKYYQIKFKLGYFLYHSSNFLLWISPFIYLPAIFLLILKILGNIKLGILSGRIFRERISKYQIPVFEFLFMIYNEIVGILGFIGRVKW